MVNELAIKDETLGAKAPNQLIALALEKNADPDTLSKLMDLQERWEAGQARKAFVAAMSAFKQEAPAVLKKGNKVDFNSAKGRTTYNYANLGSIVQEITGLLGKHNLSASWETGQEGGNIRVTCHITHTGGHRESVTLAGPADDSGNKNRIQQIGSTVTYLQRYTLLAALGLATDEDDDGRGGADRTPIKDPQKKSTPQTESKIKDPDAPASEAQIKAIHAMLAKAYGSLSDEDKHVAVDQLFPEWNLQHIKDLTKQRASDLIEALNKEIGGRGSV